MNALTKDVLSVFIGGVAGTFLRLQLALVVFAYVEQSSAQGGHFLVLAMTATLLVNVLGAFLLGALWALYQGGHVSGVWWRFCGIGGLGSFTTFSAYALDAFVAMQLQLWTLFSMYLLGSIGLSVIACALGYWALATVKPSAEKARQEPLADKNDEITASKNSH